MEQKLESGTIPPHPRCNVGGCMEEPTLAKDTPNGWVFFCDRHREDKRKAYQRSANWRHKLKVKYGIIMPPPQAKGVQA